MQWQAGEEGKNGRRPELRRGQAPRAVPPELVPMRPAHTPPWLRKGTSPSARSPTAIVLARPSVIWAIVMGCPAGWNGCPGV